MRSFSLVTVCLCNYLAQKFWRKTCLSNVDEIGTRAQFHQRSTYSFYACRSQKRKKILMTWLSSYAFGISTSTKPACKMLMKLKPDIGMRFGWTSLRLINKQTIRFCHITNVWFIRYLSSLETSFLLLNGLFKFWDLK